MAHLDVKDASGDRRVTIEEALDAHSWEGVTGPSVRAGTIGSDARAMGGVRKAWEAAGNNAIALVEIDYADILRERAGTAGRVVAAVGVFLQCIHTAGRVESARAVEEERIHADGRVVGTLGVAQQRTLTDGRV